MKYNKDEIKNNLTIEQVFDLVAELGGEPIMSGSGVQFTARTICHNIVGEGSRKLYYYDNTKLFQCYTDCSSSFDIFELVQKAKNTRGEFKIAYGRDGAIQREWQLFDAVDFVATYFGIIANFDEDFQTMGQKLVDWDLFEKYDKTSQIKEQIQKTVELKFYNPEILINLPRPIIIPWEKEGIKREVMKNRGIAYNPLNQSIIIPHYSIDNQLVGIRERTLIKEDEVFGKYRPAILNYQMYNHPLGFNLYNLNNSKNAIKILKKAIIFEGEKSSLLYASYFGEENDISVACCGSNLLSYQIELLLSLGVNEIIIAFDRQFKEIGDAEWKRHVKLLKTIYKKYGAYVQISYIFDKNKITDYKDSPIDKGEDIFLELFKERIVL